MNRAKLLRLLTFPSLAICLVLVYFVREHNRLKDLISKKDYLITQLEVSFDETVGLNQEISFLNSSANIKESFIAEIQSPRRSGISLLIYYDLSFCRECLDKIIAMIESKNIESYYLLVRSGDKKDYLYFSKFLEADKAILKHTKFHLVSSDLSLGSPIIFKVDSNFELLSAITITPDLIFLFEDYLNDSALYPF